MAVHTMVNQARIDHSENFVVSLQAATDPIPSPNAIGQASGSYLFAQDAQETGLCKKLAASEERTKVNKMVRDYKERGMSS